MAKNSGPVMRLIGEWRPKGGDWTLAEYTALFQKLAAIPAAGIITRYIKYSGNVAGKHVSHFLGVETDSPDIPVSMVALELSEDTIAVLQPGKSKPSVAWRGAFSWNWLDRSAPKAPVGDFTVNVPVGWTVHAESQSIQFILDGSAYFTPGKTADDDVHIVDYDPRWPEQYKQMADRLRKTIPPAILLRVEHFGSTAIPGMPAKPVIDILLEIPSFEKARKVLIPIFNKPEYEYWGYDDHILFIKRHEFMGMRTHHIHAAPTGGSFWERIAFRDYLRTHPADAQRYAGLKRELAERHAANREVYTNAKTAFVKEITDKAVRLADK